MMLGLGLKLQNKVLFVRLGQSKPPKHLKGFFFAVPLPKLDVTTGPSPGKVGNSGAESSCVKEED